MSSHNVVQQKAYVERRVAVDFAPGHAENVTSMPVQAHCELVSSGSQVKTARADASISQADPAPVTATAYTSVWKQAVDYLLAAALIGPVIAVCAPVCVIYYLAYRDSPLIRQQRMGKQDKPFNLYKLRTMKMGTKVAGTHEVSKDAVTRIGGLLRRTKLDELPQVFNVLVGDMSFVGPRPCLPSQTELRELRVEHGITVIKPGITGLAQVKHIDMSEPRILVDEEKRYMDKITFAEDCSILARTFSSSSRGDNVSDGSTSETAK